MTKDELIPKLDQLIQSSDQFVSEDTKKQEQAWNSIYRGRAPNAFIEGPVLSSPGFPVKTCGNDDHD